MITYWLMYLIPVSMALFVKNIRQSNYIPWYLIGFLFILLIGFRNQVGCDWPNYVAHYQETVGISFSEALTKAKDPAHAFVNWWMGQWNWGIYGVNLIYAIIFVVGLIKFTRIQQSPWLAFSVAVPYMIVMVSMGYSRQGVALGLFMLAIIEIEKGKFKTYIFWVLMAALFHKTALILLPFGLFLSKSGWWIRLLIMIPVIYGGWDLLLAERQEHLWNVYIERQMQSSGALIRVTMNFVPAILLLIYRKEWKNKYKDYPFWFWIAIASIIALGTVSLVTTVIDRISLYFIPLQLAVYSRLPYLARKKIKPYATKMIIIFGYMLVLFVWLNFASHSHCWIPYKNIIFENII
ncbi:hypothetical protein MNB_SV-3-697 [hydrothermal vent metagenome]|uniref:EpsG family protein n=1 Tax=hydrothermal vent metagenome TaxID=652676 RepID=A0A1W1C357_9ZZZZ